MTDQDLKKTSVIETNNSGSYIVIGNVAMSSLV
jgi:hypothetical protein